MQIQPQYALKQNFVKIEFENSVRRLSFLCCLLRPAFTEQKKKRVILTQN